MNICFLASAAVIHTVRWVNAMAERGHEVSILTLHAPKQDDIDERVHIYQLRVSAPLGYYVNAFEAKRRLRDIQPDVLHAHYASGYGTLARLVSYEPTILSVWGSDVFSFPERGRQQRRLLEKNLRAASRITSTSQAMKERTEQFTDHDKPVDVVPFGIDTDHFQPAAHADDDETITIGTVKKLEPIYGIDRLLRAVAQLFDKLYAQNLTDTAEKIRVHIVGDGSERDRLVTLTESLGLADVTTFTEKIPNREVPAYLHSFSVYAALSRRESFGVAVLEASACGVPVITSDVEGLPEVVRDGETGYIVDGEDTEKAAAQLKTLVADPDKRRKMGEEGRRFVCEEYAWETNVRDMEAIYRKTADL